MQQIQPTIVKKLYSSTKQLIKKCKNHSQLTVHTKQFSGQLFSLGCNLQTLALSSRLICVFLSPISHCLIHSSFIVGLKIWRDECPSFTLCLLTGASRSLSCYVIIDMCGPSSAVLRFAVFVLPFLPSFGLLGPSEDFISISLWRSCTHHFVQCVCLLIVPGKTIHMLNFVSRRSILYHFKWNVVTQPLKCLNHLLLQDTSVLLTACVLSCSVVSDSLRSYGLGSIGPTVLGIFQARILEWVAISSSRGSSRPRDRTRVS